MAPQVCWGCNECLPACLPACLHCECRLLGLVLWLPSCPPSQAKATGRTRTFIRGMLPTLASMPLPLTTRPPAPTHPPALLQHCCGC
jgi:hypothetical protein